MRDEIVAPAGVLSIAIIRPCLVLVPADLDDAGAERLRVAGLRVFRAVERAAGFALVFGLVIGFSEVYATPSVAPPQPRPGNCPAGPESEERFSRPKLRQQRSDQARKPVNSEQGNCSLSPVVLMVAVGGDRIQSHSEMSVVGGKADAAIQGRQVRF